MPIYIQKLPVSVEILYIYGSIYYTDLGNRLRSLGGSSSGVSMCLMEACVCASSFVR